MLYPCWLKFSDNAIQRSLRRVVSWMAPKKAAKEEVHFGAGLKRWMKPGPPKIGDPPGAKRARVDETAEHAKAGASAANPPAAKTGTNAENPPAAKAAGTSVKQELRRVRWNRHVLPSACYIHIYI